MFGRHPKLPETTCTSGAFDTHSYQAHLGAKLAELQDLVTFNTATAAHRQQQGYNRFTKLQHFAPGDLVWLSIPNASKLAPHWEGQWKVVEVKNDVNVKISNGNQSKVVHVNRLRHRFQQKQHIQIMRGPLMWNILLHKGHSIPNQQKKVSTPSDFHEIWHRCVVD